MKKVKESTYEKGLPVIWMKNDLLGKVLVSSSCLYIKFPHIKMRCYQIDGLKLYQMLLTDIHEFEVENYPDLTYSVEKMPDGRIDVTIWDANVRSDSDLVSISRNELRDALYYWFF